MLIVSTWAHFYWALLPCWIFAAFSGSSAYGVTPSNFKVPIGCDAILSNKQAAFLGNFLIPEGVRRHKHSTGRNLSEVDKELSQQDHTACGNTIGRAIGLCKGLKLHAASLSDVISTRVETICQRVRTSNLYKKIKEGLKVVKQRMSSLSVAEQIALAALGKLVYVLVLPRFHILFPYQLLPVNSGLGVDIGLDTIISIGSFYALIKCMKPTTTQLKLDTRTQLAIPLVAAGLLGSFYLSGYAAQLVESTMLLLSAVDVPVSVGLQRAMRILLSHLSWVIIGSKILNRIIPIGNLQSQWFSLNAKELWVYKALAGYFVSCTLYNVTDIIFNAAENLKQKHEVEPIEGTYDDMGNPLMEHTDLIPTIIAAIGPCITAPWWEEMLYRVFVFKTLNLKLPKSIATVLSAFIFSVHHMNPRSVLQLFALGVLWSVIEQGTNNLFISIAIHSLWNTRIMLGTFLGL